MAQRVEPDAQRLEANSWTRPADQWSRELLAAENKLRRASVVGCADRLAPKCARRKGLRSLRAARYERYEIRKRLKHFQKPPTPRRQ